MASGSAASDPVDPVGLRTPGELLNLLTHGLGLLLSLVALDRMMVAIHDCHNRWRVAGCIVYVASLVAVYAASTLSHSFRRPRLRHFFRTLDQVCIFFLIAGTYTPWGLTFYGDGWGWMLLGRHVGLGFGRRRFQALCHRARKCRRGLSMSCWAGSRRWGFLRLSPAFRGPRCSGCWRAVSVTPWGPIFLARRTPPLFPRHLAPDGHRRQHLPLLCHHAVRRSLLLE